MRVTKRTSPHRVAPQVRAIAPEKVRLLYIYRTLLSGWIGFTFPCCACAQQGLLYVSLLRCYGGGPTGVGGIARNVLTSLDYMEHPGTEGEASEQDKEKADLYLLLQHQERSMQLIRASIQAIERGEGLGGVSAVAGVSGGAQGELASVDEGEHCSYACIHRYF
jgi:hypothetical protein